MLGYWNAHSDLDWYDSVHGYDEPEEWDNMSDYLDLPRRSLAEARMDLMLERLRWLSAQLAAEIAGQHQEAAAYGKEVKAMTGRLRSLDAEIAERLPGLGMVMEDC